MEQLLEQVEIQHKPTFMSLLPMKAHYLFMFGGNSASTPYMAIFAKQMGVTADVIGYTAAAFGCITVITRPIIGALADHFQKFKLVLICMLFVSISTDIGLSLIPQPARQKTSNFTTNTSEICYQNNSYRIQFNSDDCIKSPSSCEGHCSVSCTLCEVCSADCININSTDFETSFPKCLQEFTMKCIQDDAMKNKCNDISPGNSTDSGGSFVQNAALQIALYSTFAALFFVCQTALESLTDAACGKTLGDQMDLYGRQRMWGTVGWGAFSLLAGYLNHVFSVSDSVINYTPGFYLSISLFFLDMVVLWKLKLEHPRPPRNIFKDVGWLLLKPKIILFILQVTAVGIIRGIFNTYLLWYLQSLGASALLLGSVTSIQCFLGEVLFFFLSGWIIQKLGYLNVFTMSFIAHGLRFLAYSFLTDPKFALVIEILQGPSFSSFYSALTAYVKLVAPKGAEATVQGIALAALEGLGK
ncbi:hypothetical protein AVEN_59683-1 [Araneus ventricosus]|uniref:Major facilitator superfamily associated domain-containing protein n=1 Tax=Araneus ventricosus TaxID=182803 RepID=A0A4Y2BNG5_ARAVE|nr:hypothetical protein AVEN_59683-1 [Araneus ventricosus]